MKHATLDPEYNEEMLVITYAGLLYDLNSKYETYLDISFKLIFVHFLV